MWSLNKKKQDDKSEPNISSDDFCNFISGKTLTLLIMSTYIIKHGTEKVALSRPYFGRIHLESAKLEELLDAYGAKNNKKWHTFRKTIATVKCFSNVIYIILHIRHSILSYNLLEIEGDFFKATDDVLNTLYATVVNNAIDLVHSAYDCGIAKPTIEEKRTYDENLPSGKLLNDRKRRKADDPEKNIVYLATKFLNFSEEIHQLEIFKKIDKADYASCFPEIINEEKVRWLENKFHSLQSFYDTHISDSNLESIDTNLPILRGHASVIYHLLEVGTELAHYYERHLSSLLKSNDTKLKLPITQEALLSIIIDYIISFTDQYLKAFHDLSKNILKQYAEEGKVEVNIPNYRGFHVRPSTLVSRIVNHYGSNVYMEFDKEKFDAAKPLELFRINEKINAIKRKNIAKKISTLQVVKKCSKIKCDDYKKILQQIFIELLEEKSLILYESNFSFDDISFDQNETLLELANKAIARYLALGRIDITNNLKVVFTGDKRVLEDLKVLAENGYGEDNFGNNIFLPKILSYLKR